MGQANTVMQHQLPWHREVDPAVEVRAQEHGEGRDERRKQRAWDEKKVKNLKPRFAKIALKKSCASFTNQSQLQKISQTQNVYGKIIKIRVKRGDGISKEKFSCKKTCINFLQQVLIKALLFLTHFV